MNHLDQPKKAILIVSYGSSSFSTDNNFDMTLQKQLELAFHDYAVYPAIISHAQDKDSTVFPFLFKVLEQLHNNKITTLYILPTFLLPGHSFLKMQQTLADYQHLFHEIHICTPLLATKECYESITSSLATLYPIHHNDEVIVFFGHGSSHSSSTYYNELEAYFHYNHHINYFVLTLDFLSDIEDFITTLHERGIKYIRLVPLLMLAGYHVFHDMAGKHQESLYSVLTTADFKVDCVLSGLGNEPLIQQLFIEQLQALITCHR
ncbi:sirohydrochlorin cobaltochelatase [Lachnoclostridium sp.]|uniref:sirohydrochlorin cobaltochelatase n=1 Tax=Lachnoclostridium sp. TaxID=2028282 RepID=UPI00289BED3F|nr:sirohydrochlorin cobaltochelatase [Lachnoclostridium sp.]